MLSFVYIQQSNKVKHTHIDSIIFLLFEHGLLVVPVCQTHFCIPTFIMATEFTHRVVYNIFAGSVVLNLWENVLV